MNARHRILPLAVLTLLLATPALALVCSPPFQSWDCADAAYYDLHDGQPGEVVCGVDFTGWTLHVVEMTLTEPGWVGFQGISAVSGQPGFVQTTIMLMDDCGAGTCLDSATSGSIAELIVCLDAGTHTVVFASQTQDPNGFFNIGASCVSCEDAAGGGYFCDICQAVGNDALPFGELKSMFR